MNRQNGRLAVLVTSMLAFTLICVTTLLALRLHRAREVLLDLVYRGDCGPRSSTKTSSGEP